MCRLYECKRKPSYIRLCYRTGRAVQHVEIDDADLDTWRGRVGCKVERVSRGQQRREYLASFRVMNPYLEMEAIQDQAIYMDAEFTIDYKNSVVTFKARHWFHPGMFARATSFGWSQL